ncbi:hypothetical protein KEM48_009316 [Puccinia striiformis f. sp. tritici PST-130]|nr:hypothetical protein Pst134EB_020204 [Puccinia striiformis f. sp. tritici]KAI9623821.1 hypothetical protein KEM48_009316 [Puccinia striiformis f. sp. tritici PST-130]
MRSFVAVAITLALLQSASALPTFDKRAEAEGTGKGESSSRSVGGCSNQHGLLNLALATSTQCGQNNPANGAGQVGIGGILPGGGSGGLLPSGGVGGLLPGGGPGGLLTDGGLGGLLPGGGTDGLLPGGGPGGLLPGGGAGGYKILDN